MVLPIQAGVEDSTHTSVQIIEEVEVHARRLRREVSSTTATQEMHHETMEALAIQNAADAMRHFAGTNVKDYGGIGGMKTVSVRGLGATHTAVSYDDVVIGNCQAGQIDLGRFSSNGLGSISLHVGQNNDMMATARALASGSLVSMSSLAPQWNGKRHQMETSITVGSFGLCNPTLMYAQRLGERTWMNTDIDFSTAHGRYPYTLTNGDRVTTERRTNTDVTQLLGEWDLHHDFADGSHLDTKVYYYDSERGLPGAVILYHSASAERLADRNAFAQARYTKHWGDRWQLRTAAKYTYGWNRYTDTNVKYDGGKQVDENLQHEYYAQATLCYNPTLYWQLSVAQDAFVNTLTSNLPSCPDPVRYTSLTAFQAQYRTQQINIRGIVLGTIVQEASRSSSQEEKTPSASLLLGEGKEKAISPTLSASFRPFTDESFYLRMMYKHTFRMPTFNDLYYFRSGNKDLRPERAREYTLGLTWQAPTTGRLTDLMMTVDGYFNNVTDKIVAFPTTYVWKMANYGRVHITGLDATLSAQCRLTPKCSLNAAVNYTLNRAIDVTDSKAQGFRIQLPYTPVHSGSGYLLLATPWVNMGYSVVLASERYSMSEQSPRYRIAPYTDHTITLARTFVVGNTLFTAQAEALNITDAQYQIIQYYPMPGRQFRLTLTVKL